MAELITVAVLAGTTREQRESIKAARYVAEFAGKFEGVEVIFVDPKEFNFPGDGNDPEGKDPRYTDIVRRADAFFIVTPEYNHSFPGSLKRMLDSELELYSHKPVAFAGASNGNWGGGAGGGEPADGSARDRIGGAQLGCLLPTGAGYFCRRWQYAGRAPRALRKVAWQAVRRTAFLRPIIQNHSLGINTVTFAAKSMPST